MSHYCGTWDPCASCANEKPLHVKVAETLGWIHMDPPNSGNHSWKSPEGKEYCTYMVESLPPNYDTDWAATGPLIEKYKVRLYHEEGEGTANGWIAESNIDRRAIGFGPTALISTCNLILSLDKEDNLK